MSAKFGLGCSDRPNFETSFLISQQKSLRLRHLSQIVACNFKFDSKCSQLREIELENDDTVLIPEKFGYFFTLAIKLNTILYTSELVNDMNPCWRPFDLSSLIPPDILSAKGCIVRIWFKDKGNKDILVLSWGVHFSGLVPIGKKFVNISQHVASDTIMFRVKEMLYTSPECRFRTDVPQENRIQIPMYHTMSLPSSEVKAGSSVSSMCRIHSLKRSKFLLQRRIDELRNDLENFGISDTSDRNILQKKVERARLMVSVLTERLEREIVKLRSLTNVHDQMDTDIQEKSMYIFDKYHALNRELSKFQKGEELVESRMSHLEEVVGKVRQRRIHLLRQLPIIFPITHDPIHKDKMYICNVHLPEAEYYGNVKDSCLNVALGFVAQLLVAISNLINIPLAFPVNFFGSTSYVTDRTSVQAQVKNSFPLHSRGKEKILFDDAVFLLNKNIAQLRWTCRLATPNLRPTLFNIWTLLNAICNPESNINIPDVALKSPLNPISLDLILGQASIRNMSDNKDVPVKKTPINTTNNSRKYDQWKAIYHFDMTKKSVNIERSCSLDSGLCLLRNPENSTFIQLDSLRRTNSYHNINELENLDLDEDLIPTASVEIKPPEYIDGLNESDRKTIDESFELIKNKYFLKRSNSLDRLLTLNAKVSLGSRRSSDDSVILDTKNGVADNKDSIHQVTDKTPEVVNAQDVQTEDNSLKVETLETDPLLEVFSRTSALANQNFTFKYSNKRSAYS